MIENDGDDNKYDDNHDDYEVVDGGDSDNHDDCDDNNYVFDDHGDEDNENDNYGDNSDDNKNKKVADGGGEIEMMTLILATKNT